MHNIYIYIYYTKTFQAATFWNPYRVFLKGLYTFRHPLAEPRKNATGYGDNDVDSTIFGRDGWRRAEQQKL